MRVRKALVVALVPFAFFGVACGAQDGCYDDGERVQCGYGDDDDRDDDDEGEWEDD